MDDILIVIPSLEPDEKLIALTAELKSRGFTHLLIINDGSDSSYDPIFEEAAKAGDAEVLRHVVNQGKGRAMKTAFNEFLINDRGCKGIVTVDSDGQHKPEDIRKVAEALIEHPESLILGSRNFDEAGVPLKSSFGNKLTRKIFGYLSGIHISDTQTGLRGFSPELIRKFMKTNGERFEYEMNMLMDCKDYNIPILEVPIQTVYLEDNKSTHFNPIRDSIRIYAIFGKFIIASLSSSVIDLLMFAFLTWIIKKFNVSWYILAATVGARIVSSFYNYSINKGVVFKSEGGKKGAIFRYYALAVVQMLCSAGLVWGFYYLLSRTALHVSETGIKIVIDTLLFLVSFKIQKEWVFKK